MKRVICIFTGHAYQPSGVIVDGPGLRYLRRDICTRCGENNWVETSDPGPRWPTSVV